MHAQIDIFGTWKGPILILMNVTHKHVGCIENIDNKLVSISFWTYCVGINFFVLCSQPQVLPPDSDKKFQSLLALLIHCYNNYTLGSGYSNSSKIWNYNSSNCSTCEEVLIRVTQVPFLKFCLRKASFVSGLALQIFRSATTSSTVFMCCSRCIGKMSFLNTQNQNYYYNFNRRRMC